MRSLPACHWVRDYPTRWRLRQGVSVSYAEQRGPGLRHHERDIEQDMADPSEPLQPTLPLPPDPPEETPPCTVAGPPSITEGPQPAPPPPAGAGATIDFVPPQPAVPPRTDSADSPRTEA